MSFEIRIKVVPKSSTNEIVGWENQELKIRLRALPEKGRANAELIQFLAKTFQIAKSQIELTLGNTSRHKRLLLHGMKEEVFLKMIEVYGEKHGKK